MKFQNTLSLASLLGLASSHTIFVQLESAGTTYPVSYAIRDPSYDGPINDVTSNYIACNGGPNPTTATSDIVNVTAGSTVQAIWRHTLTSDATDVIDASHKGPVQAYLKKVSSSVSDVGYGSGWFKVQQAGLNVATQDWAVTDLIAAGGVQSIVIPSCIANGEYLLRAEVLALHAASSLLGAQFYMECAQIRVTGGTGTGSPSTVSFPGAYAQNDPGILINIYQTLTTYVIPGPTPFVCGAAQSTAATTAVATKTSAVATTLTTSTKAPTTTSTATTGAALYAQCGGANWTGATTCASGTCTYSSAYYSQCLP